MCFLCGVEPNAMFPRRQAIGRRPFLAGAAAALAAPQIARAAGMAPLPERRDLVFRNAMVLTMDPSLGEIAGGDVLLRGGTIVAVGRRLDAAGAQEIDATGMVVMPGLVETHWHTWSGLLRSLSGDDPKTAYFRTSVLMGMSYTPEDMYQGTRICAAEAIDGGITFVHDWCHNARSPAHVRADLRALAESGIRSRFSYAHAMGWPADQPNDLADLRALHQDWAKWDHGGLISLGMGFRGTRNLGVPRPPAIAQEEFDTARALGIPITIHAGMYKDKNAGDIAVLAAAKMLGPDVQLVHATHVTDDEIRAVAQSGAVVSFSPFTELRIGFGIAPASRFFAAGVPVGLSVDTTALSGDADMFAIMKALENEEDGKTENEFQVSAKKMLSLATIEGARSMGVDKMIGSLTPGKRADVIMIDARGLNMAPLVEPTHLVVEATQPRNVVMVVVDGRVLKSDGKLTAIDPAVVVQEASVAAEGVRARTKWP
jgi:5-methylthioadenosine/S-adenosylhomocysteine deaminase